VPKRRPETQRRKPRGCARRPRLRRLHLPFPPQRHLLLSSRLRDRQPLRVSPLHLLRYLRLRVRLPQRPQFRQLPRLHLAPRPWRLPRLLPRRHRPNRLHLR